MRASSASRGTSACGTASVRLAVPDHHLVADVPLNAEIAVRNVPAERRDLGDHCLLVGGLDRGQCVRDDDRTDHRERRRQADLETDALGQLARASRAATKSR